MYIFFNDYFINKSIMNTNNEKKEIKTTSSSKSNQQEIYNQIRKFLDTSMEEYTERKEKEEQNLK